mgnify:FL=1
MLDGVLDAPNGVAFIVGRLKLGMFIPLPVAVPAVAVPVVAVEEGLLAPKEEAVLLSPKGVC